MNYDALVQTIVTPHREALGRAALAVNRSLILRNWTICAAYGAGLLSRPLMAGTGKGADFAPYLETLRTQHKAKRNFMRRLDGIESADEHRNVVVKRVK